MSKKYSLISEQEIEAGLASGAFSKNNVGLIRNNEGQIVKHLKERQGEQLLIPPTIVQVHQNTIYQANLAPVIDLIIETNTTLLFEDLEEIYHVVLDKLRYYKSHKQRLDELNSKALEALSIFEKRIKKYIDGIDAERPSQDDRFFCAIDCYLNLIFIYMISAFWLHGDGLSNDTIALGKIENLEAMVKDVYKNLLINSRIDRHSLQNSVYAYLFVNGGTQIHLIEKLVKHDDRCKSPLDFFESFRDECISRDYDSRQTFYGPDKTPELICRLNYSLRLHQVIEKTGHLRNIFHELLDAGTINFDDVDCGDDQVNKKLQLTVIPLALHDGSRA
jgi:hypothetical protein